MSHFLDARSLAMKLRVTPATVLTWARRGWIPCLRAGAPDRATWLQMRDNYLRSK